MQTEAGGITMRYEITGPENGPVVVLSHCLSGSMAIWSSQVAILEEKYRVLCYDLRGHSGSDAPDEDYSMEMLASDAAALLDTLEIESAHFMGISLGGMIGQQLALMHPEKVSSLILCDTACRIPEEARPVWEERIAVAREHGMAALADGTMERWLSPSFQKNNPETTQKIKNIILQTPVAGYAGCCRAIAHFDVMEQLKGLSVPTLILVGENDPGTPVEMSLQIQSAIRDSVMVKLPRAYHLSNIEAAREFNENVLAFLSRQ